jgi:hypothetical protein
MYANAWSVLVSRDTDTGCDLTFGCYCQCGRDAMRTPHYPLLYSQASLH